MERTNLAAALDKSECRFFAFAADVALVTLTDMLVCLFAADPSFVGFNDFAFATKRAGKCAIAHCFAQAMRHEPRRFVAYADHAVQLMRRNALLAACHQEGSQEPLVERDMRTLKQRADLNGKLL